MARTDTTNGHPRSRQLAAGSTSSASSTSSRSSRSSRDLDSNNKLKISKTPSANSVSLPNFTHFDVRIIQYLSASTRLDYFLQSLPKLVRKVSILHPKYRSNPVLNPQVMDTDGVLCSVPLVSFASILTGLSLSLNPIANEMISSLISNNALSNEQFSQLKTAISSDKPQFGQGIDIDVSDFNVAASVSFTKSLILIQQLQRMALVMKINYQNESARLIKQKKHTGDPDDYSDLSFLADIFDPAEIFNLSNFYINLETLTSFKEDFDMNQKAIEFNFASLPLLQRLLHMSLKQLKITISPYHVFLQSRSMENLIFLPYPQYSVHRIYAIFLKIWEVYIILKRFNRISNALNLNLFLNNHYKSNRTILVNNDKSCINTFENYLKKFNYCFNEDLEKVIYSPVKTFCSRNHPSISVNIETVSKLIVKLLKNFKIVTNIYNILKLFYNEYLILINEEVELEIIAASPNVSHVKSNQSAASLASDENLQALKSNNTLESSVKSEFSVKQQLVPRNGVLDSPLSNIEAFSPPLNMYPSHSKSNSVISTDSSISSESGSSAHSNSSNTNAAVASTASSTPPTASSSNRSSSKPKDKSLAINTNSHSRSYSFKDSSRLNRTGKSKLSTPVQSPDLDTLSDSEDNDSTIKSRSNYATPIRNRVEKNSPYSPISSPRVTNTLDMTKASGKLTGLGIKTDASKELPPEQSSPTIMSKLRNKGVSKSRFFKSKETNSVVSDDGNQSIITSNTVSTNATITMNRSQHLSNYEPIDEDPNASPSSLSPIARIPPKSPLRDSLLRSNSDFSKDGNTFGSLTENLRKIVDTIAVSSDNELSDLERKLFPESQPAGELKKGEFAEDKDLIEAIKVNKTFNTKQDASSSYLLRIQETFNNIKTNKLALESAAHEAEEADEAQESENSENVEKTEMTEKTWSTLAPKPKKITSLEPNKSAATSPAASPQLSDIQVSKTELRKSRVLSKVLDASEYSAIFQFLNDDSDTGEEKKSDIDAKQHAQDLLRPLDETSEVPDGANESTIQEDTLQLDEEAEIAAEDEVMERFIGHSPVVAPDPVVSSSAHVSSSAPAAPAVSSSPSFAPPIPSAASSAAASSAAAAYDDGQSVYYTPYMSLDHQVSRQSQVRSPKSPKSPLSTSMTNPFISSEVFFSEKKHVSKLSQHFKENGQQEKHTDNNYKRNSLDKHRHESKTQPLNDINKSIDKEKQIEKDKARHKELPKVPAKKSVRFNESDTGVQIIDTVSHHNKPQSRFMFWATGAHSVRGREKRTTPNLTTAKIKNSVVTELPNLSPKYEPLNKKIFNSPYDTIDDKDDEDEGRDFQTEGFDFVDEDRPITNGKKGDDGFLWLDNKKLRELKAEMMSPTKLIDERLTGTDSNSSSGSGGSHSKVITKLKKFGVK